MPLPLGLFCRPHQVPGDVRAFLEVARMADEAGLYSFGWGDHLLMSENVHQYAAGTASGRPFPHPLDTPWLEPLTAFAAVAAATKRIRLTTGILLAGLRPPVLLAKMLATLDVLSAGRLEPGIGVGWQPEEYAALGLDWSRRYRLLDDAIRGCRTLWAREQPVQFISDNASVDKGWAYPLPVQERIPILYGVAGTERNARRIAELGDGWYPGSGGRSPEYLREGIERIREAYAAVGRDPASLIVRVDLPTVAAAPGEVDIERTLAPVPALLASGITVVGLFMPESFPSLAAVERFVAAAGAHAQAFGR